MNRLSLIAAAAIGIRALALARPPVLDLLTPKCESTRTNTYHHPEKLLPDDERPH